jgi:hypothetical protein
MSAPNKSFFSSLAGLITGVAGILTAAVAVFGVAVNQGWLHGGASSGKSSATTAHGASAPQYSVQPTSVDFQALGGTTANVSVLNTGTVAMNVEPPAVTGSGGAHFSASSESCAGLVTPGRSCQIQVIFNPSPGSYSATLVVQVAGASRATEVGLKAQGIL